MTSARHSNADRSTANRNLPPCDLVLKGGVTSGVVYPPAIQEIARSFRLKGIGGASAGAIGAVGAAAAELGRQRLQRGEITDGGFDLLGDLAEQIVADNLVANFFQPQPETRALFNTATRIVNAQAKRPSASLYRKALDVYSSVLINYPVPAALGAVSGALVAGAIPYLALSGSSPGDNGSGNRALKSAALVLAVPAAVIGAAVASLPFVARDALKGIPANNFGMCSGLSNPHPAQSSTTKRLRNWFNQRVLSQPVARQEEPTFNPALTEWLDAFVNELAGQSELEDRPVIYRDIWTALGERSDRGLTDRDIDLQVITTCLTHGTPYRFPFTDGETFYFRRTEFEKLFPPKIVNWLVRRSPTPDGEPDDPSFFQLPPAGDLPIVMAARISLSFPILLSAIPLWTKEGNGFERCWFSDGGISSNFPIHFFDSPIPRWPTLAINLSGASPGKHERVELVPDTGDKVWFQKAGFNAHREIGGVLDFLLRVQSTARNWSDNYQARLSGYSDRIIYIGIDEGEGGLNLNMPPQVSARLLERGRAAGAAVRDRFKPGTEGWSSVAWGEHRWLRYAGSMAVIDDFITAFSRGYTYLDISPTNRQLIESRIAGTNPWFTPAELHRIITITEGFSGLNHVWSTPDRIFDIEEFSSRATLRVRPRV